MARTDAPNYRPKYRKQRPNCRTASVRAFVEINGERHYLGDYGTPESRQAYDRLIAEWLSNRRTLPVKPDPHVGHTVAVVVAEYLKWADEYFRLPDGTHSTRLQDTKDAVKPLCALYGNTLAAQFTPQNLEVIQQHLATGGKLCRKTINERAGIIKRVFKRSAARGLVSADVFKALECVEGLAKGKSKARESQPVSPVAQDAIEAVKPHVSRQVWSLIELQLLTGARPGELVGLRPQDLDMNAKVWFAKLDQHKTAHHGKDRVLAFGPKAQAVLLMYLTGRPINMPFFSPKEADAERRAALSAARKTPLSCGNTPGSNKVDAPAVHPGDCYDVASYRRAIARACDVAFPHPELSKITADALTPEQAAALEAWRKQHRWHPHQLRHNAATRLEREYGYRATQAVLGHSREATITLDYVAEDKRVIEEVMLKVG